MHEIKACGRNSIGDPYGKTAGLFFAFILLFIFVWPALSGGQEPDKPAADMQQQKEIASGHAGQTVVARVNGTAISLNDLIRMIKHLSSKKETASVTPESIEQMRSDALQRLINQELVLQRAMAEGLKVEEKKIDEAMSNLKKKVGGDEEYRQFLEQEQATEESMRARAERTFILELAYAREVQDKVDVPESAERELYDREKDKYVVPEKVSVTDVVFFLELSDESVKKAEKVLDRIRLEKELDPRQIESDGTFIVRDVNLTEEHKELYTAAKKLKVGELSDVVRTSDSLHIIKLKTFIPLKQYSFEQMKNYLRKRLVAEARQKRFKEWEAELRKDAKIEIYGSDNKENGR